MTTAQSWQLDIDTENFVDKVWPIIKEHIRGGYLITTETSDTFDKKNIQTSLDKHSCIDFIQVLEGKGGCYGITARIQYDDRQQEKYETFTIRLKRSSGIDTEFTKLKRIFKDELSMKPAFTVQAFLATKTGKVNRVAIIRTKDLLEAIHNRDCETRVAKDKRTGQTATFACLEWTKLQELGYGVRIIHC